VAQEMEKKCIAIHFFSISWATMPVRAKLFQLRARSLTTARPMARELVRRATDRAVSPVGE